MRLVTELELSVLVRIKDINKQRTMKRPAKTVVNLVQKVLPLVPKRLWPVPENRPPAALGCWIKITPINKKAVKIKRMPTRMLMILLNR